MGSNSDSKDRLLNDALTYANELLKEKISNKYLRKQLMRRVEDILKRLVENGEINYDNYEIIINQVVDSLIRGEDVTIITIPEKVIPIVEKKVEKKEVEEKHVYDERFRKISERARRLESIVSRQDIFKELTRLEKRIDEIEFTLQQVVNQRSFEKVYEVFKRFEDLKNYFQYEFDKLRFELNQSQKFAITDNELLKRRLKELEDELIRLESELKRKEEEWMRGEEHEKKRRRKYFSLIVLALTFTISHLLFLPKLLEGDVYSFMLGGLVIFFILFRLLFWR